MSGRLGRTVAWTGVAVLVVLVLALGGWRLHGGRWVRVETASMGTDAPVGTLLWVAPARFESLRPGDLITFRPPGAASTYSHLVRSVNADGTVSTQGRITAPDPWRIRPENLVGKVVWRWSGVGWLLVAAPVLALGGLLVTMICWRVRDRDLRLPVALVGGACVVALALVVYRPLTRADQLAFVPSAGGARATYVSTGLLPVRVAAAGGNDVVLHDGEVGSVLAPSSVHAGKTRYRVAVGPHLPAGWQAALASACFLPAVVSGRQRRRAHRGNRRS